MLLDELVAGSGLPRDFVAKIFQKLVRGGILRSAKGRGGGFALARPQHEITLMDIVEAVEGPLSMTRCALHTDDCGWSCDCPASLVWPRVQDNLRQTLGGFTLEALLCATRRNGRVASLVQLEPVRAPLAAVG